MPAPQSRARAFLVALGVACLLILHAGLGISATRNESTTVDEMAHMTAGHALWAHGDYRLQPENGVLPQLVEGLPAVISHRRLPPLNDPGWAQPNVWTLGHVYFHQLNQDLGAMLLAARATNMLWSLATGLLVFGWARRLFGLTGGFTALLFWAFCPNFLAHGALATSDMCMTFFMLASVSAYWWHLQRLTWTSCLVSALFLGLAFVAKYSAVLLPPMFVVLAAIRLLTEPASHVGGAAPADKTRRGLLLLASAALHLSVTVGVIWAFYRFRFAPVSSSSLVADYTRPWAVVLGELAEPTRSVLAWARGHHVLPDAYLYGFGFVVDFSQMRGSFLNGERSMTGWVTFFPYAFLAKSPLALLATIPAVGVIVARHWHRLKRSTALGTLYRVAPLGVLFAFYWAFSLTSTLNIGLRHLLPTYPVLFIGAGALGWSATRWGGGWRWLLGALALGQIAASEQIRPHYLAFFNRAVGGPSEGYRHLVDSSLDWGQDLPGLAAWLRERKLPHEGQPVYFAYFGTGDPDYYGIRSIRMVPLLRNVPGRPWYRLEPGVYCVSATLLQQTYSPIRGPWSAKLEKEFHDLHAVEPALLDYDRHPENRRNWEHAAAPDKWTEMWTRYEQIRFARLCLLLRARQPEAQIGYSINVYRLSTEDIAAVNGSLRELTDTIERAHRDRSR